MYLTLQDLRDQFHCGASTIYRWMKYQINPFPKPKQRGGKRFWLSEDIKKWEEIEDTNPRQG